MAELQQYPAVTTEGVRGTILRRARFLDPNERSTVHLEDGRRFEVGSSEVQVRPDGTFLVASPLVDEGAPTRVDSGAPTRTQEPMRGTPPPAPVADALYGEEAAVERVAVNRLVESMPETRQEGDVTVVPIVEEVLVYEKRLLLREELHIRRTRTPVSKPRRVLVDGDNLRLLDDGQV